MSQRYISIVETLINIEKELRELRLWEAEMISAAALMSAQPFAVDTMSFPQWLQFIFLPRMHALIEQQAPLPCSCSIAPMAEHYFSAMGLPTVALLNHLKNIDALLSQS